MIIKIVINREEQGFMQLEDISDLLVKNKVAFTWHNAHTNGRVDISKYDPIINESNVL